MSEAQIDLENPQIMSPEQLREVRQYSRIGLRCTFLDRILDLTYLGVVAFWLARPVAGWLADATGWGDYLTLLLLILAISGVHALVSLPLSFYDGFLVERRFGLSRLTPARWFGRWLKRMALAVTFNAGLVVLLFGVIRWLGPHWWWAAALVMLLIGLLFGLLLPVVFLPLFYRVERLEDDALLDRFQDLTRGTGLRISGVFRMGLSVETAKANACLAGLWKTRRVLLGDTLLENFSQDEIEAVFAHEVGHHVHRHVVKLLLLSTCGVAAFFAGLDVLLRVWLGTGPGAVVDYAHLPVWAMPMLLFVTTLAGWLAEPVQCTLSRHFERQSDAYAARTARRPEALATAFVKLAIQNKADPDPHWLEVFWMHDHPALAERIRNVLRETQDHQ